MLQEHDLNSNAERYHKCGYILVQSTFSAIEINEMKCESDHLLSSLDLDFDNLRTEVWEKDGKKVISKIDPVADVSEVFLKISFDTRILNLVNKIFKEEAFHFKDKLIYKMPDHPGFGPHQDLTWYPKFPKEILAVVIAIDDFIEDSGPIEVAEGLHDMKNPVPVGETRDLKDTELPNYVTWNKLPMKSGDMLIMSSNIPHRSSPNVSKFSRRALFLSYSPMRYGDLYLEYYKCREGILKSGMGENVGNFDIPAHQKNKSKYSPHVKSPRALKKQSIKLK